MTIDNSTRWSTFSSQKQGLPSFWGKKMWTCGWNCIISHYWHHSANYPILMSNLKMAAIGKNVNYAVKWKIDIIFKIILCILVLYLRYKTVNKQLEIMNVVIYSLKWSQVQCFFQMVCFFHVFSLWCNIFRIVMLKKIHVMRVAWISHLICLAHIYNHVRK